MDEEPIGNVEMLRINNVPSVTINFTLSQLG